MNLIEEIVLCMPLVATMILLLWPEPKHTHTPLHLRKEPTLRSKA